jgi:hypothetical protein
MEPLLGVDAIHRIAKRYVPARVVEALDREVDLAGMKLAQIRPRSGWDGIGFALVFGSRNVAADWSAWILFAAPSRLICDPFSYGPQ